jgi:hypothetical protein
VVRDTISGVKTVSISLPDSAFQQLERAASSSKLSLDQLILRLVSRSTVPTQRARLSNLPVLQGHQLIGILPSRAEIYDETASRHETRD